MRSKSSPTANAVEYSVVCIFNSAVKRSAQNQIKNADFEWSLIGKFWNICGHFEGIQIEKLEMSW